MNDFAALHDGHIRLAVLRLLDGAPGFSANDSVLTQSMAQLGLLCTRDQMRGHLAWLEEQRAVTLLRPTSTMLVANLTERGGDLARGRSVIPGVQQPSPGSGF